SGASKLRTAGRTTKPAAASSPTANSDTTIRKRLTYSSVNRRAGFRGSDSAENDRSVGAAESKRIGERVSQRHLTRRVGHVVQIATFARLMQVDGGRRHLIAKRQHGEYGLDAAGRSQQMPRHRFRRADGKLVGGRPKGAADRQGFGPIAEF